MLLGMFMFEGLDMPKPGLPILSDQCRIFASLFMLKSEVVYFVGWGGIERLEVDGEVSCPQCAVVEYWGGGGRGGKRRREKPVELSCE